MKNFLGATSLAVAALLQTSAILAGPVESTFDLIGRWEGALEFGKFKFAMVFRVAPSEDKKQVKVTMELPDQGASAMPCSAILYNPPDVRIETDQPPGVISGKVNADRTVIEATFSSPEIPGGKPMTLVLKRNTEPEKPKPTQSYVIAPGETPDIRGYWKGAVEFGKDVLIHMGLKVGRLPDGTFKTQMDAFEFGGMGIPAASTTYKDGLARFEWQMFQSVFEAKLDATGKVLSGKWKQRGDDKDVSFERLDRPATALPETVSFEPEKGVSGDIRGHWEGDLSDGGRQMRMVFHIGQMPDKSFAGSVINRSQGPGEVPAATASFDGQDLKMEWKLLRATFNAKLSPDGAQLEGEWKQGGNSLPITVRRVGSK